MKSNLSDSKDVSVRENSGSYYATNVSLRNLISEAFGIREGLVSDLPGWADKARFDVSAKFTDATPESLKLLTPQQRRAMLAAILHDRFGLKVHSELKTLPIYDLIVSKGGPKFLQRQDGHSNSEAGPRPRPGDIAVRNFDMVATDIPISRLVDLLADYADRTVIDKTELTGTYDLHLKWTPDSLQFGSDQSGESGQPTPALFAALQEQLGLKLVSGRGPVVTLVLDQVDRPSAN